LDTVTAITPTFSNTSTAFKCYNHLHKPITTSTSAILDSGTMGHYLITRTPCTDIKPATTPIVVHLPHGHTMQSTHTCNIDLPGLPQTSHQAHLFPALSNHDLLSVGQLCDHGCHVCFTAALSPSYFILGQQTLFTSVPAANGLWTVLLTPTMPLANAATTISSSSSNTLELLQYRHA
jgi:hypothetical protein